MRKIPALSTSGVQAAAGTKVDENQIFNMDKFDQILADPNCDVTQEEQPEQYGANLFLSVDLALYHDDPTVLQKIVNHLSFQKDLKAALLQRSKDTSGMPLLQGCVHRGNTQHLEILLNAGAKACENDEDPNEWFLHSFLDQPYSKLNPQTATYVCALHGKTDMLELILNQLVTRGLYGAGKGRNWGAVNYEDWRIQNEPVDQEELQKYVIANNYEMKEYSCSCVFVLAMKGHTKSLEVLLNYFEKYEPEMMSLIFEKDLPNKATPIEMAAFNTPCHTEMVTFLKSKGVMGSLLITVALGDKDSLFTMLDAMENVDCIEAINTIGGPAKLTPLMVACKAAKDDDDDSIACIQKMLSYGADVNIMIENANHENAFWWATQVGSVKAFEALVNFGQQFPGENNINLVKVSKSSEQHESLFYRATARGHVNLVRHMIEHRDEYELDIKKKDKTDRFTILWGALCTKFDDTGDMVRVILQSDPTLEVNHVMEYCGTALRFRMETLYGEMGSAPVGGEKELRVILQSICNIQALLEDERCDPNLSNQGMSPLMLAVSTAHLPLLQMFLRNERTDVNFSPPPSYDGAPRINALVMAVECISVVSDVPSVKNPLDCFYMLLNDERLDINAMISLPDEENSTYENRLMLNKTALDQMLVVEKAWKKFMADPTELKYTPMANMKEDEVKKYYEKIVVAKNKMVEMGAKEAKEIEPVVVAGAAGVAVPK